jgi:D-xylose 1-dehydrogenase (NADP+, D-xylono-1,5-lactone-forming)
VGWGILGAAWIAGKAVIPAIKASRNGRLVAIASREPQRAGHMAAQFSIPKALASYEAVLEDPDVDAVYIPLVNSLHREWTLKALAAGKHVLCEKPLAMNTAEVEEMVAAAATFRRCLMEAYMYRFHPRTRDFIDRVRGEGAPVHVQASFGFLEEDRSNYRMVRDLGGGALMDVGCYAISASRWILGEPDRVLALAHVDPEAGVDMTTTALLRFGTRGSAALWCSFESAEHQELTVITPHGTLSRETPFTAWRDPDDPYQLMVESFGDSVIDGTPVAIPPDESIANMRVIDRVREAAGL